MSNKNDNPVHKEESQKKGKKPNLWALKVFFIALSLSIIFSTFSQIALTGASIFISIVILLVFLILGWISDIIGMAVSVCELKPFLSMASRKIAGAKTSIKLISAQAQVSSVCNDIIGDICSIISGTIGFNISLLLTQGNGLDAFIVPILVSSLIAAITISGKALGKIYAIKRSHQIIQFVGRMLSFFEKKPKKRKKPLNETPKAE